MQRQFQVHSGAEQQRLLQRQFLHRHLEWTDRPVEAIPRDVYEAMFLVCCGVLPPEKGGDWEPGWEQRDADNLYQGVLLHLKHPEVAGRPCSDCKKWWYDENTGRVTRKGGKPLKRPADTVTMCQTQAGCPKGTPEKPVELTDKNRLAWIHYKRCKATFDFPDDQIVRANAVIIERAIKKARSRHA